MAEMDPGPVNEAIAAISGELEPMGKDEKVSSGGARYSFASIQAMVEALKPLMAKHGLALYPSDVNVMHIDRWEIEKSGDRGSYIQVNMHTVVVVKWTIAVGSSWTTAASSGESIDTRDKANSQALSMARRNLYKALFHINEVDEDKVEREPQRAEPKRRTKAEEKRNTELVEKRQTEVVKRHGGDVDAALKWLRANLGRPDGTPSEWADLSVTAAWNIVQENLAKLDATGDPPSDEGAK